MQFCRVLQQRWKDDLKRFLVATPEAAQLSERDVILSCAMLQRIPEGVTVQKNAVVRTVRCSLGITLRVVADKILIPAVGFVRNYHCWVFTAISYNGAIAVPVESQSIDMMHLSTYGEAALDDREVQLCCFLRKEGDVMTWVSEFPSIMQSLSKD